MMTTTFRVFAAIGLLALKAAGNPLENGVEATTLLAEALGIRFVEGSASTLIVEREGREYVVDLATRTIRENGSAITNPQLQQTPSSSADGAAIFRQQCSTCHGAEGKGLQSAGTRDFTDPSIRATLTEQAVVSAVKSGKSGTTMPSFAGKLSDAEIRAVSLFVQSLGSGGQAAERRDGVYEAPDDYVYSLPTGRGLPRRALYVNFTHRFAYNPAFSGRALGDMLLGLDGFAISSFGFRYGVTDKLSVSAYRSPTAIGRPIELMAAYQLSGELNGQPLNTTLRVSVDGQDDFTQNFTTNFEAIVSRSVSERAQLYFAPTFSLKNRRLISKPGALEDAPPNLPGINSFSLGVGGAWDIRPTVALVAEVIPTLYHGRELGIHRPAYSFGIQKRVRGHAFTLGFSNSPGTVVAQRAGTRATFLNNESADKPSGLFIGFNLMRRLR